MSRLTQKCQITIPKHVRQALGLRPGVEVDFEYRDGDWILRKRISDGIFGKWRGRVKAEGTSEDLLRKVRGE